MSEKLDNYWRENVKYLGILLAIWMLFGFILPIVFGDKLNSIRIGGFKLGFWIAQQGAIYVFVILIFHLVECPA